MKKTRVSFETISTIIQKDESVQIRIKRSQPTYIPCGHIYIYYDIIDSFQNCRYKSRICLKSDRMIIRIPARLIGSFSIRIEKVYCFDLLQCFALRHMEDTHCFFYVFPHFKPEFAKFEESLGFYEDALDYSPFTKGEDYSEIFDIRTYRENDSLKHIHWKVTTKKNELYVKEGSQPIVKKILIAVQYDMLTYGESLERFYSVCLSLLSKGVNFEILCPVQEGRLSIESIQSDLYFKECFLRILKSSSYPLEEYLSYLKGYSDIYLINANGIEVRHL